MANNPMVSVIIPIYGVEKYIERCARSLFEQTLDDIEYIFVNDCTKDNSIAVLEKIIEDYPNRKNQITILHHTENKGLPQARKTGIMQAKGEYIAHCDSDDWVDKDMYRAMYDKARNENADIVFCDYYVDDGATYRKLIQKFQVTNITKDQILVGLLKREFAGNVWSYISRRALYYYDINYPTGNMLEDWCLTNQIVFFSNNIISYLSIPMYHYFINPKGITKKSSEYDIKKNYQDSLNNTQIVLELFSTFTKINSAIFLITKLYVRLVLSPLLYKKTYYNLWRNTYPEIDGHIIKGQISIALKIKYLLSYFRIYPLLYHLKSFIYKKKQ